MNADRTSTKRVVMATLLAAVSVAAGARPASAAPTKDPVVIVAGTFVDGPLAEVVYAPMKARLQADGYTVSIFGLPGSGLGDISATAGALADHVEAVRASTGAAKVDLVGHSQGGIVARAYITYFGGAAKVDSTITLGSPNQGTALGNLLRVLGPACTTACQQMAIGSAFLAQLNAGDQSVGDVVYTNLTTVYDALVVPYTSAYMDTSDGNITNVTVQAQCRLRVVTHVGLATDGAVYDGIDDALSHEPVRLRCFAL